MKVERWQHRLVVSDGRGGPLIALLIVAPIFGLAVWLPSDELLGASGVGTGLALLGFLPAVGIGFMGWMVLRHLRFHTTAFDLVERAVHVRRRNLFGQELLEIPLRDVARVEVEETVDGDGDRFYYLTLVLRRGGSLRLTEIGRGTRRGCDRARDAIAAFLESAPAHGVAAFD